jgi:dephospho-CoA kinase
MLKVGLTGGIASGKSVVGEMFVALGAHLLQADRMAHSLMQPGEAVYDEVVRHFGREILDADGTVNRGKLAEAAFGSPRDGENRLSRISELNAIVHPAVLRNQNDWMISIGQQNPHAVAIVEAALILEAKAQYQFDRLLVVTCGEEQRIARFAARQKLGHEEAIAEVQRRMAAQLPDAEKIKAADFVIDNSGSMNHTRGQVRQVWDQLQTAAVQP